MINNALQFLMHTLLGLFTLVLMLRFYLQLTRAPFHNPASQAIVVMTNTWSSPASGQITRGLAEIVLPSKADPVAEAHAERVRAVYDQLRTGTLDRSLLTPNASYYFTPTVTADFQSSLAPLGAPTAIVPDGGSALRGGFVIQGYTIKYPDRELDLSVFMEPGANGRVEQFLVSGS